MKHIDELELAESLIGRLNFKIDMLPQDLCFGMYSCEFCGDVMHEDKLFDHEGTCQGNTGGCLDPDNCGTTILDFDAGDFEGYCENCREDMEHALQCEMDLFYHGRS